MNHNLQRNSQSSQSQTVSGLDRTLLDQPTYFEKCIAAVDRTFAQYCAICGEPYTKHSGLVDFRTGLTARCPIYLPTFDGEYADTTFKKYGICEGSIPENCDLEGVNAKPCRSKFGTYRPEQEAVLCDCCAEGL